MKPNKLNGWLVTAMFAVCCGLVAHIVNGIGNKVDAHEIRIQDIDKNLAVQQEILVRIEWKIDKLIETKEK